MHPRLPGHNYPFAGLCGAGVAFKLAWALCQLACGGEKVTPRFRDCLMDAVALVALVLGTVEKKMLPPLNSVRAQTSLPPLRHADELFRAPPLTL